jgi:hypothetical protein
MANSKKNISEWRAFIDEIRSWDRREHNWSVMNKMQWTQNLVTPNDLIHLMMKRYKLSKKKRK